MGLFGSIIPLLPLESFFSIVKGERTLIQNPTIYMSLFETVYPESLCFGDLLKIMPWPKSLRQEKGEARKEYVLMNCGPDP